MAHKVASELHKTLHLWSLKAVGNQCTIWDLAQWRIKATIFDHKYLPDGDRRSVDIHIIRSCIILVDMSRHDKVVTQVRRCYNNKTELSKVMTDTKCKQNLPIEILWSLFSSFVTSILESSPRDFMSSTVMYLYWCWSPSSGSSPKQTMLWVGIYCIDKISRASRGLPKDKLTCVGHASLVERQVDMLSVSRPAVNHRWLVQNPCSMQHTTTLLRI